MASSLKTSAPVTYATWATSTIYTFGQQVIHNGYLYVCTTTHTAGTFDTDFFASNYWSAMTAPKDGWTPLSSTFTYASADSPTYTMTVPGDLRNTGPSVGQRIKLDQSQTLNHYWTFDTDGTDSISSKTFAAADGSHSPTYTSTAGEFKFTKAASFDGTNQALKIGDDVLANNLSLAPTGEFTVGGWVRTNTASKFIVQSISMDTAYAGWFIYINSTGKIQVYIGNNTGTVQNVNFSIISGDTDIRGTSYHYVVVTYKNNWIQIYVDGNLDGSGYVIAPVYATANYFRFGVECDAGTSMAGTWFNGQLDDWFLISGTAGTTATGGYALDEQTIRKKYEAGTAQRTSAITVTKNFIISLPPTYSTPNTTITMDGGTDFSLTSGTISNVYFSGSKAPKDFNVNSDKWSVQVWSPIEIDQASPTISTWYNIGGISIIKPIGLYKVIYRVSCRSNLASGSNSNATTLSTANNTAAYPEYNSKIIGEATVEFTRTEGTTINFPSLLKTTLYLNASVGASSNSHLYFEGNVTKTVIKATNAYL